MPNGFYGAPSSVVGMARVPVARRDEVQLDGHVDWNDVGLDRVREYGCDDSQNRWIRSHLEIQNIHIHHHHLLRLRHRHIHNGYYDDGCYGDGYHGDVNGGFSWQEILKHLLYIMVDDVFINFKVESNKKKRVQDQ